MEENSSLKFKIEKLTEEIAEIKEILVPISETYRTATTIGSWTKGLLVFISVTIGAVISIRELLRR